MGQFAVAVKFIDLMFMARKHTGHRFAPGPESGDGSAQAGIFPPWRTNGGPERPGWQYADQFLEIQTEADGRTVTAKHRTDLVITAAARQLGALPIDGKAGTAVIGVA